MAEDSLLLETTFQCICCLIFFEILILLFGIALIIRLSTKHTGYCNLFVKYDITNVLQVLRHYDTVPSDL